MPPTSVNTPIISPIQPDGRHRADAQPGADQDDPAPGDQRQDVSRTGAEGHPNADLRCVLSFTSDISDHDADIGNWDDRRLFDLHGRKPWIDEIAAGQNDLLLQPLPATRVDKRLRVLKGIAIHAAREHVAILQRMTVARFHDSDGVLTDGDELLQRDDVLPRPETEMKSRRERIGLQACLAVQRDDRTCRQRPMLTDQNVLPVDDTHRVFRHDDHTKETRHVPVEQDGDEENEREAMIGPIVQSCASVTSSSSRIASDHGPACCRPAVRYSKSVDV